MPAKPSNKPSTFDNPSPGRDYLIHMEIPEFTCLCPLTGQPDFARLRLKYIAGERCVEVKSLKLYLQQYRSRGIFCENVTNVILNDLVAACRPRWMRVRTRWTVRGGIHSVIAAEHGSRESD